MYLERVMLLIEFSHVVKLPRFFGEALFLFQKVSYLVGQIWSWGLLTDWTHRIIFGLEAWR